MKKRSHREMLGNLADAVVADILNASDEEILAETEEVAGSAAAEANRGRDILKTAQTMAAKKRLAAARAVVERQRKDQQGGKVISLNPAQARRTLATVLKNHPESTQKFTLAARKGKDLSDSDVMSMLEDLQELGLYDPDADTETKE